MKKLIQFFIRKTPAQLKECQSFEITKDEADTLCGGFKEYKPPIYEPEEANEHTFRTVDLLTDIHQTK
jgi:hypothetical protein